MAVLLRKPETVVLDLDGEIARTLAQPDADAPLPR